MNHLSKETSPYLLQHAHNPVHWYAWKPEAFAKAKAEDKPILVSIGYSTCHWCHVMERESFENEDVAAMMNEYFVNIKVDREERPDVDQIYMEACQIISGSGGWPLNCFLTPDGRPFYAGTYFPPRPAYQRPSWPQVLQNIHHAFQNKREDIEQQADKLTDIIQRADNALVGNTIEGLTPQQIFTPVTLQNIFYALEKRFDKVEGGFGSAPKFPGTMVLQYLLNHHYFTKNKAALEQVNLSLRKMIFGGIYDQIGGGFARYSTDRYWLAPHFEKMLYDNALLVSVLSNAYKLTKNPQYKETIEETFVWVEREMTSPEGGFYSALDADSEGEEGKFYVWQKEEIDAVLGEAAAPFNAFYDVSEEGNWEHKNILRRFYTYEQFANQYGMEVGNLKANLKQSREKLLKKRATRIRPGLDDKILLDWNALMCSAYAQAYQALQKDNYKTTAIKNMEFLLEKFQQKDRLALYHTYKEGQTQYDAFLNDYAFLIAALIDVYSITFQEKWLGIAEKFTEFVLGNFWDAENNLFFFTSEQQQDLIARRKDLYDSALPSGNSTMVHNLQKLGILLGKEQYRTIAKDMLLALQGSMERYPSSFARWASALSNEVYPIQEIAIIGTEAASIAKKIQQNYFIPNQVMMASTDSNNNFPLLADKTVEKDTFIFVCQNYACQLPVKTIEEFKLMING